MNLQSCTACNECGMEVLMYLWSCLTFSWLFLVLTIFSLFTKAIISSTNTWKSFTIKLLVLGSEISFFGHKIICWYLTCLELPMETISILFLCIISKFKDKQTISCQCLQSDCFVMTMCQKVSTTTVTAMGCQQCLPLSVVQLKGKHCRKPHCRNGVVVTYVPAFTVCF